MSEVFKKLSDNLDEVTGVEGSLQYAIWLFIIFTTRYYLRRALLPSKGGTNKTDDSSKKEEEEEEEHPRNFTVAQLKEFDGTPEDGPKSPNGSPPDNKDVYLSLKGQVFNASHGRDFYGPDGPYEKFAGKECGVALAKMSFEEELLGKDDFASFDTLLSKSEQQELEGWIEKFTYYRPYPIVGRLIPDKALPDPNQVLTAEDLLKHRGLPDEVVPEGYATAPIYIGAGENVYDVSFGGYSFYGPGGGYHLFAGKDVSRALAKMSFDPADVDNPSTEDLPEKNKKILEDWIKTFETRKKYPIVGKLKK